VNEYQTLDSVVGQPVGSSGAAVASTVLVVSVKGTDEISVALSKSSFAGGGGVTT
jgi:hypothetical protein